MRRTSPWTAVIASAVFGVTGYLLGAYLSGSPDAAPGPASSLAPSDIEHSAQRSRLPTGARAPGTDSPGTASPAREARCPEAAELRAANRALSERIQRLRQAVDTERAMRSELEGVEHPFPASLDAKFTGPGLQEAIAEGLEALALEGDINAMDCSEFPCMAYGELRSADGIEVAQHDLTRLHEELRKRYPGAEFYISQSAWSPEPGQGTPILFFSMTYYEKPASGYETLERRMRHRKNQFFDALTGN